MFVDCVFRVDCICFYVVAYCSVRIRRFFKQAKEMAEEDDAAPWWYMAKTMAPIKATTGGSHMEQCPPLVVEKAVHS